MQEGFSKEPIAIVGSACRFPGESTSPSKLWTLLNQPRDVLSEFNPEHLNLRRFYNSNGEVHGATNVQNKTYLLSEDSRLFDAGFFGISPLEAEGMDPQQRVLLETVFETFEAAGYTLDQIGGSKTSVHVGVMTGDYADIQLRDMETAPQYTATGTGRSILSNRVSYVFDLHGPSVTIDTACSSSLVALHLAIQSIQAGDSTSAIVGGANLIFDPSLYIMESKLHMLSPESRSRMWDKAANGYARGEGVAALLLKPLCHALRDNDHIEAIIRGTGVNSDGHSQGITMPRASAQAALIRETYRRAGLDPIRDRCSYFEAHGTGTAAGDPVEARAIFEALIGEPNSVDEGAQSEEEIVPLYVGSIKTVVGHLEGCAGLAGVLKVVLALQNRTIPPNMLFNELNPEIEQFYGHMQIPTTPQPWPKVQPGSPLRASVNSFGFGGTNAHAIIESYEPNNAIFRKVAVLDCPTRIAGPFLFSANSGSSLLGNVRAFLQYLVEEPDVDLHDLAWVLQKRRSAHRVKTSFSAESRQQLIEHMEKFVAGHASSKSDDIGIRGQFVNPTEESGILGIFTGQGAQWPAMGRQLLTQSALFRRSLERCDAVLKALPDGPDWTLIEELSADAAVSRIAEASISQPLCTALQIGLVDLLAASGVRFASVVGHSSGEIAAVYSCGIIDLAAAIQIAYYRGKHAHLAHGIHGEPGAMLAVGVGLEAAEAFCKETPYQGRICVAASNAPQTVTLSGDLETIHQAKEYFEALGTFNRLLRVDTAYHSHHMQRCADTYLCSLTACDIQVRQPKQGCIWNSSVRGDTELLRGNLNSLKGSYWVKNMTDAVLFSHAVKSSIWHGGPFDLAIEVGPSPALKGPTEQTLQSAFGMSPSYTGVLSRGSSDSLAFSAALGFIWSYLGPSFVNFEGYRGACFEGIAPRLNVLKDLPSYAWEHDRSYWRESRISRRFRKGLDSSHELLGRRAFGDTERDMQWRNILKLSELPWVRGHEILGEALLPGASYISLAFEAGKHLAAGKSVRLLEVRDVEIYRPVIVPPSREGTETIFTMHALDSRDPKVLAAEFTYYYCPDERVGSMVHTCSGRLLVHLGTTSADELPHRAALPLGLLPIDSDDVYSALGATGLRYSGIFRRLQNIHRCRNYATATASWTEKELQDQYIVHPVLVDVCFQSLMVAHSDPSTGLLQSTLLPVHIERLTLNPSIKWADDSGAIKLSFESFVTKQDGASVSGDLHIYDASSGQAILQVETLSVKPVSEPTESEDRKLFSTVVFKPDASLTLMEKERDTEHDKTEERAVEDIERVTLYYIQRVLESIDTVERSGLLWYFQRMFESFEQMVQVVQSGTHPLAKEEWLSDGPEILDTLFAKYPDQIDMLAIRVVGENIVSVVRGESKLLELLLHDNILTRIYMEGCGYSVIATAIVSVLEQISHKFPRADILEIGAGTGATTATVFKTVGDACGTYTFTDISTGFFETAANRFADFSNRMIFKALDVEKNVTSQGFQEHTYDIVIAANVLHATTSINTALKNARSLLKPGGFLLLVELTGLQILRIPFSMGGFEGWFLGSNDGRALHPGISTEEWDQRLQDSGFSGVDMAFHDTTDYNKHTFLPLVSQAVNDTLMQLREPLTLPNSLPQGESIIIIGGKTSSVSKIASAMKKVMISDWESIITIESDIESVDFAKFPPGTDVVCLQELDAPIFSPLITQNRLKALQKFFLRARNVLWVTKNRRVSSPQSNMLMGIKRALSHELPQVNIQMLDLELNDKSPATARTILEVFARLKITALHSHDVENMLWSQESEIVFANGHMLVPRVIPNAAMNDRYNSIRRTINKSVPSKDTAIGIAVQHSKLVLTERKLMKDAKTVRVRVLHALLIPSNGNHGRFYISVGHVEVSNEPVLVLSNSNVSILEVHSQDITPIEEMHCTPTTLQVIAIQLLAQVACDTISNGESALFYEPSESMAVIISDEFARSEKQALFASSATCLPLGWMQLHPQSSIRAIKSLVPQNLALFVNCSTSLTSHANTPESVLPPSCKIRALDSWFVSQRVHSATSPAERLAFSYSTIRGRSSSTSDTLANNPLACDLIDIQNLSGMDMSILDNVHITCWQTSTPFVVGIQPIDREVLFDPKKTYLMVGMAGGLGLSICGWALRQGAKHLVITSRKPKLSSEWLEHARLQGVEIVVHAMDVTKKASVESIIRVIRKTLPPIGGICNAAMVLDDKLFIDMDANSINTALQPKVEGSQHLNDVLADTPLDFFVFLASAASIIGNPGQSNYHSANEYMVGLAKQRRQQGLPASVIHIGGVADVGYVTRQAASLKAAIRAMHVSFISESDVHYAFAEAIFAGKPDSGRSCEIIVGLDPIKQQLSVEERPAWLRDPLCSFLLPPTIAQNDQRLIRSNQEHIKQLIEEISTEEEAIAIVEDAFQVKLESMMQLPPGSVEAKLSLIDLGIDSLVGVEIRMWFLKELGIDVPVLKILGGDSVSQICTTAAKQVLARNMRKTKSSTEAATTLVDNNLNPDQENLQDSSRSTITSGNSSQTTMSDRKSEATSEADMKPDEEEQVRSGPVSDFDTSTIAEALTRDLIRQEKMSGAQSRVWILSKYLKDHAAYNLLFSFEMEGALDIWGLRNALMVVMQHHESLRTCFFARPEDNQPIQGILQQPVQRFRHISKTNDEDVATAIAFSKTRKWDIEHGETLGVTVLSRSAHAHTIIFDYHHIIMDATGWGIFLRDLNIAYRRRPLIKSSGTYIDHTIIQQYAEQSGLLQSQLNYWQREYSTLPQVIPLLPMSRQKTRPSAPKLETSFGYREVDVGMVSAIKKACRSLRITPFHFHLAIVQVLLVQALGIDDLSIGIADANRLDDEFAETIGFFMNLLPVRFQVSKDSKFSQVAQNTSRKVHAALENSAVPFDMILDSLKIPRSSSHTPLFQVALNYRLGTNMKLPLGDSFLALKDVQDAKNPYDISFGMLEGESGAFIVEMTAQTSLYDNDACQNILDIYLRLLNTLSTNTDCLVQDCHLYQAEDISNALHVGRGPQIVFDWPLTLSERFQSICEIHSGKFAIQDGKTTLTYTQLMSKMNSIAAAILEAGYTLGSRIAVRCEPSLDSIASLLAILHVGGIYIPLDISLPSSRHEIILESCNPSLLLCHTATEMVSRSLASNCNALVVSVDHISTNHPSIISTASANSPAVFLYTSGSTGKPKGVLLTQANLVNHIALKTQILNFSAGSESVLQQSSVGFDMSLIQTFCALCNGGTLVVVPQESRRDPTKITQLILQHHITLTIATPSEYLTWFRYGLHSLGESLAWRHACMGGESVTAHLKQEFKRLGLSKLSLINCYGPTEITAAATFHTISLEEDESESQSIVGKPLPNYSVCILDPHGNQALPIGFRGEICIGGAGVALGYLDLPAETALKFIPNIEGSGSIYRTGDQGLMRPDGTLIFLGRLEGDSQIKLRGIRIELGEVEAAVLEAGEGLLSSTVVSVHDDILVAHAVLSDEADTEESDLQQILSRLRLPQYMVPARIILVDHMPTTTNGKVDRKAISEMKLPEASSRSRSRIKLTLREGELRLLWEKVLPERILPLIPTSDFFLAGGNSLLLVKLQHAINEAMGVSISTSDLYQNCTLQQMALRVCANRENQVPSNEEIDWALEIAIPESVRAAVRQSPAGNPIERGDGSIEILLTGATSFLGRAILRELLQDTTVSKIHCVAVLPDDQKGIPESEKISLYTGSLSSPSLGLSQIERSILQSRVDVIFHAGANGHCLNNYSSLRAPNLHSTQFLATIALPFNIPILYLSSNRVSLLSGNTSLPPVSVKTYLPPTTGAEGFTASKWASECFLENLAKDTSLPIEVHRPCIVVGASAPNSDALNAILRYSLLTKAVPLFERMEGFFDFKNVEDVARELVTAAIRMTIQQNVAHPDISFHHHSSGVKVPIHNARNYMSQLHGCDFRDEDIHEWMKKASQAGMDPLIVTYLESLIESGQVLRFPYLGYIQS